MKESIAAKTARKQAEAEESRTIDRIVKGLGFTLKHKSTQRARMIAKAGDDAVLAYSDPLVIADAPSRTDYGTGATPQRLDKAAEEVESVPGISTATIRLLDGSVLDACLSRRNISFDQYNAGAQFYRDWFNSGISGVGAVDLERPLVDQASGSRSLADLRIACADRFSRAKAHVGPVHFRVLSPLILEEEGLEAFGRRRFGYNTKRDAVTAAIAVLRLALEHLVEFYLPAQRSTSIVSTHREDFRPGLSTVLNPSAEAHP